MFVQSFDGSCIQWKDVDFCEFNDEETKNKLTKLFNISYPETEEAFQKVRYRFFFRDFFFFFLQNTRGVINEHQSNNIT